MNASVAFRVVLVTAAAATMAGADDSWPRFRGPDGNGVSAATGLPTEWSPTKNIRWKTPIPGEGCSSPIVWQDRVFITSSFERGARRVVHCLERSTGKMLWSSEIKDASPERTSAVTGHAAATPVCDGKRVIAFFGNAGVVCYDIDGKQIWQRSLGEFDTELGLASSPVLHQDTVILVCDHDGSRFTSFDSFLVALDVQTGKTRWKTDRPNVGRSWSTPILVPVEKRRELIVCAEEEVRGYDPESGKLLWQMNGLTGWVAPSPVFGRGLIFATSGKDGPIVAVKPGGAGKVKPDWQIDKGGPYYCSPLIADEYFYLHDEKGVLTCFEADSGKEIYRERLQGKFTASAVAGDGKLYITNEDGTTFVIRAGSKFKVLHKNALEEYTLASPAIAGKDLLIRTEKHLYCIMPGKD